LFTESEKWHMAALGVDLVTLAGVTGSDNRGNWGTGFMAGCWSGHQHNWRCSALGMSMYGDLLDDVSAGEMWKNAAIRGGLEAMKLFL
jgi:hypothetical protein